MLFSELLKESDLKMLSRKTKIPQPKLVSYAKGIKPTTKHLEKICEALDVDVDEIIFDDLNISIAECAATMGKGPNFVRAMIRNGEFGYCDGKNYHIPRKQFEKYMGITEDDEYIEYLKLKIRYLEDIRNANLPADLKSA